MAGFLIHALLAIVGLGALVTIPTLIHRVNNQSPEEYCRKQHNFHKPLYVDIDEENYPEEAKRVLACMWEKQNAFNPDGSFKLEYVIFDSLKEEPSEDNKPILVKFVLECVLEVKNIMTKSEKSYKLAMCMQNKDISSEEDAKQTR